MTTYLRIIFKLAVSLLLVGSWWVVNGYALDAINVPNSFLVVGGAVSDLIVDAACLLLLAMLWVPEIRRVILWAKRKWQEQPSQYSA